MLQGEKLSFSEEELIYCQVLYISENQFSVVVSYKAINQ